MAVTVGFRCSLALKVYLSCAVDCYHAIVLHDDVRKVRVLRRAAKNIWVAVDCRIERARSQCKAAHDLPDIEGLGGASDDATSVEIDDSISQHFRMYAEIAHPALEQQGTYRVRHCTNANLQARAIVDLSSNLPRDSTVDISGWRVRQLYRRPMITLDDVINFTEMDAVLRAIKIWQTFADFDDNDCGTGGGCPVPEVRGTEVEEAVAIYRAGLQNHDVRRLNEATVVVCDLAEIARNVVASAGVMLAAVVRTEVPAE